jgi:hypothetical protein
MSGGKVSSRLRPSRMKAVSVMRFRKTVFPFQTREGLIKYLLASIGCILA